MQPTSTSKNNTILVIDDNPVNLGVVVDYLTEYGYEVVVSRDGQSGLHRARFVQPDLILLDVMMPPGIDGFETCRQLKMEATTAEIPVIFMTALADESNKVKGFEVGGVDYVTKPLQMAEVLARIKTHLTLQKMQADIQNQNEQLHQEITERQKTEEALREANQKINILNKRLAAENTRLEAELNVARQIQQLLLPSAEEFEQIKDLDIAAFMEPADEVGGDYYDVLQHHGKIKIALGDVTGHGLQSGLVMLMSQTAVRTLMTYDELNSARFLNVLNQTIYHNVQRMQNRRTLSLVILDYEAGDLKISGQHEDIIFFHQHEDVTLIDTTDLGFPLGMLESMDEFVNEKTISLKSGDGVVLYTDGLTEAMNGQGEQYGIERLCQVVKHHATSSATEIEQAVMADFRQYVGQQRLLDDVTLLIIKRI